MRRTVPLVLTSLIAVSGIMLTAAPAYAAKSTPSVTINASPEPVVAGKAVKVAGRVGTSSSGSNGRVNYYFKSYKSTTYAYKGYSTSSAKGYYSKSFTQSTSGTWRVRFLGNAYRYAKYSGTDYVEARKTTTRTKTVFSMSGVGDYVGPPVTLPSTSPMRATVTLACVDDTAPFISFEWNGHPTFDWATVWAEPAAGDVYTSTTQYMYPDVRDGYFEISTQSDCSWDVTVTQPYSVSVKV